MQVPLGLGMTAQTLVLVDGASGAGAAGVDVGAGGIDAASVGDGADGAGAGSAGARPDTGRFWAKAMPAPIIIIIARD